MDIQQIDEQVAACGQLQLEDIAALAQSGIKTIICNRPDGEDDLGQPNFDVIAAEADKYGIAAYYVPVIAGQMDMDDVVKMADIVATAQKPLLAYCRSGMRSTNIYGLAKASLK